MSAMPESLEPRVPPLEVQESRDFRSYHAFLRAARSYTETFKQSQDALGKLVHDVAGVLGSVKVWLDEQLRRGQD